MDKWQICYKKVSTFTTNASPKDLENSATAGRQWKKRETNRRKQKEIKTETATNRNKRAQTEARRSRKKAREYATTISGLAVYGHSEDNRRQNDIRWKKPSMRFPGRKERQC